MSPEDEVGRLERLRQRVADEAAALERTFDDIVSGAEDVATDDEHDPEGHTIAFERQQVAALRDSTRRRVTELDAAIERARDGSYGRCEVCGRRIGAERLEALPETRRCISCARTQAIGSGPTGRG